MKLLRVTDNLLSLDEIYVEGGLNEGDTPHTCSLQLKATFIYFSFSLRMICVIKKQLLILI